MKVPVAFFLGLIFLTRLFGDSSVWKVSDGQHTIYIGGTIHLLRPSDYPLPIEFDRAYEQSDYVIFETDIAAISTETFASEVAARMILPPGKKLSAYLKPETYSELRKFLSAQNYPIALFEHLQPWGVMLTLTQLQMQRYGIDQNGADAFYAHKARHDGKTQYFLETPQEQLSVMARIGKGEEDAMILQTIKEMEMIPLMMEWLVDDWQTGRIDRMTLELVESMKTESPSTYKIILAQRNDAWMPKIVNSIKSGQKAFILVGAMHLLGNDGLLERLKRNGYSVVPFRE